MRRSSAVVADGVVGYQHTCGAIRGATTVETGIVDVCLRLIEQAEADVAMHFCRCARRIRPWYEVDDVGYASASEGGARKFDAWQHQFRRWSRGDCREPVRRVLARAWTYQRQSWCQSQGRRLRRVEGAERWCAGSAMKRAERRVRDAGPVSTRRLLVRRAVHSYEFATRDQYALRSSSHTGEDRWRERSVRTWRREILTGGS